MRGAVANGFELDIISMVLLGGVSIFGGVGSMMIDKPMATSAGQARETVSKAAETGLQIVVPMAGTSRISPGPPPT